MNTQARHGFTIIETVLFLGVTGLMVAAMFIGINSTISTQRYRDAVESFKSTLQQQYAELSSVENTREGAWTCAVSGTNLIATPGTAGVAGATYRGQAACDVVGRYVAISGSDIRVYTILARKNAAESATAVTDIEKLSANYTFGTLSTGVTSTGRLDWGTKLGWPLRSPSDSGTGDRSIGILVLRSPDSGSVYTFTSDTISDDIPTGDLLKSTIAAGDTVPGRKQRLLCVDSDGLVLTPSRGIYIDARASDSSAVRVNLDSDFNGAESC